MTERPKDAELGNLFGKVQSKGGGDVGDDSTS